VREESRESRDKARDNGHRPEGKATIVKVRTRASWTPFRSGTSWTSRYTEALALAVEKAGRK